jgi:putative Mn2+ efflux pump MntP
MPNRIAATTSLIAFAICLVMGMVAENPFSTILLRALAAMGVTLIVGMVLGAMGQKMIEENIRDQEKSRENSESKSASDGR